MQTAASIMSPDLVTLNKEQLVYYALLKMQEHDLRHIPVTNEKGELVGIISDRDLKKQLNEDFDPESQGLVDLAFMMRKIEQVMTPAPVVANPDSSLLSVAHMMLEHKISSIVITPDDSSIPCGIITSTDMLRVLTGFLEEPAS